MFQFGCACINSFPYWLIKLVRLDLFQFNFPSLIHLIHFPQRNSFIVVCNYGRNGKLNHSKWSAFKMYWVCIHNITIDFILSRYKWLNQSRFVLLQSYCYQTASLLWEYIQYEQCNVASAWLRHIALYCIIHTYVHSCIIADDIKCGYIKQGNLCSIVI